MNDLISIVVPVYNVEKYIDKCITSIINQTYKNIEIILVDDGSPDSSGIICDNFKKNDKRIKVIHKKNGGVSSARNSGLEISNGKYVTFIDGDDFVDNNYIKSFTSILNIYPNTNIIFYENFHNVYSDKKDNDHSKVIFAETAIESIYNGKMNVAVWNKMYSAKFLKENNIHFNQDIWYGEGMLFNIECLQYTDSVVLINKKTYHQRYNSESAMRNFNFESNLCGIRSLEIQKEKWKKNNKKIENSWIFHRKCFNISIMTGILKSHSISKYKNEFNQCKKNMRKTPFISLKVNIPFKQKIMHIAASFFPVTISKIMVKKEFKRASNS